MSEAPSLVICGARVHGVDGADAVAVTGERISAIGSSAGMLALRSAATHVAELPGALICPGFHDAHAHLLPLVQARREIDLHDRDAAWIRDAVATAAADRDPARWIVGRGYDPEIFRGTGTTPRALLDAATPGRLVLLRSHDYHSVALSSEALRATGFLPAPAAFGADIVERDTGGEPTGILRETAAMAASALCSDATPQELARDTIGLSVELAGAGITALHDMSGSRHQDVLRALDEADCLPIDVFATISPGDAGDAHTTTQGRRLRIVGMKAFLDGALGSRTAHLLEPYEGETCHCGVEVLPREAALEAVRAAAEFGLPSYLHAIGDAAVRAALDVLADLRAPDGTRLRHRVEHAQMIHDDDLPRFAALGIVASLQPVHMALDAPLVHRHWGARSHRAFPVRRLLDSGAHVAFGSDTPIETFDPVAGLRYAVQRTGRDGTLLHAEEAVTVAEAIDAYTAGAAWAVGAENELGTIRTGRVASFTVLSEDVVRRPKALADTRVALSVVRGSICAEVFP